MAASRPKGRMPFELFVKIVDDLSTFPRKVERLHLYKDGEPLLHPRFPDMVAYAKTKNIADMVETTTNGSLLTAEKVTALLDAGLDGIRVSVYGVDNGSYKKLTRSFSDYARIKQHLSFLWAEKERRNAPLRIHVKIIDTGLRAAEREQFCQDFAPISDSLNVDAIMGWSGTGEKDLTLGLNPVTGPQNLTSLQQNRVICPEPFKTMAVNFNGAVSVCCVDWSFDTIIGDATHTSLVDIWNGEELQRFRHMHLMGRREEISACAGCHYALGCPQESDLDPEQARLSHVFSVMPPPKACADTLPKKERTDHKKAQAASGDRIMSSDLGPVALAHGLAAEIILPSPYAEAFFHMSPFDTRHVAENAALACAAGSQLHEPNWNALLGDADCHILTPNARAAIFLALSMLHLKSDDEVLIVTSSASPYVSSCVTEQIARVCRTARTLSHRTRAVLLIHEFGFPATLPKEVAKTVSETGIPVIEDCAYALGSTTDGRAYGRAVGRQGNFAVYSFSKAFPVQYGGLLALRAAPAQLHTLKKYAEKTEAEQLSPAGRHYLLASLAPRLAQREEAFARRRRLYALYQELFAARGISARFSLEQGIVPHAFVVGLPESRGITLKPLLQAAGIESSVFYGGDGYFLPNHQTMTETDVVYIVENFWAAWAHTENSAQKAELA